MQRAILLLLLLSLLPLITNSAEPSRWRRVGPPAGKIEQIVPDRQNPNLWFAINQGVLYRTESAGQNWVPVSPPDARVVSVTIHPVTSHIYSILFVEDSRDSILWASQDHGKSFGSRAVFGPAVSRIVPHAFESATLYGLGNSGNLLISIDDGFHWKGISLPYNEYDLQGASLLDLMVSPFEHHTLYMNLDFGEIYTGDKVCYLTSTDNGSTWTQTRCEESWGTTYYPEPLFPDRVMAVHRLFEHTAEIQELTKAGWQTRLQTPGFDQLSSIPGARNVLLALVASDYGGNSSMWRSLDRGTSWRKVNVPGYILPGSSVLGLNTDEVSYVIGSWYGGVFSCNRHNQCESRNKGFRESNVSALVRASSNLLFASTSGFLYRTNNSGKNWVDLTSHLPIRSIELLGINPRNPSHLIVAGDRRFYFAHAVSTSTDFGSTWELSKVPTSDGCSAVEFDPVNPGRIWLGCDSSLLVSRDAGKSFGQLPVRLPKNYFETTYTSQILVTPGVPIFLIGQSNPDGSVLRSTDGGNTFSEVFHLPYGRVIGMMPLENPESFLMYAGNGALFRSSDGGSTWQRFSHTPRSVQKLCAADLEGKHLFAIALYRELFESKDSGRHWKNITGNLDSGLEVNAMADPKIRPFSIGTNKGVYQKIAPGTSE